MSWGLTALPLHNALISEGGVLWQLADGAKTSFGLPLEILQAGELPTVAQILAAFRESGCHGLPWFQVANHDVTVDLPSCSDPSGCASIDGLDLGEIMLGIDSADNNSEVKLDWRVTQIGFRKPSSKAVLLAITALAEQTGPILVFDDDINHLFVVSSEADPSYLAANWPW